MFKKILLLAALALVVGLVSGCGAGEEELAAQEQEQEWQVIQDEYAGLSALRAELAEMRGRVEAGVEGDEETGLSPEEALENLKSEVDAKVAEVNSASETFVGNLVVFINTHAGFEGEEMNDIQKAAIRLKSDEDIELARDYVQRGGDYKRAIDILENAMLVDPGYQGLADELERIEGLRFMTEERFAAVEKGMTEDEVRGVLGQVFHANVREYPENQITAWFYTREGGAAAAVYFRENRGALRVYDSNFNAVETAAERAE
jgi:hypothetical protein